MSPDLINALFELGGAYFTWTNFRVLKRERSITGVYWPATGFFTAFGLWNLLYYKEINQPLSLAAGLILCSGNLAWLLLLAKLHISGELKANRNNLRSNLNTHGTH